MSSTLVECEDFSLFQEALKAMRKTDDIIVNAINSVVPTDSFHANNELACKNLYEDLESGNVKREKFIKNCITLTKDRVKELREKREANLEDLHVSKQLRSEQTKLRMLQVELSVEDLVRQRTTKVFNEKCRKFYNPL